MSILIKNVILNEKETDILIQGNTISKIQPNIQDKADKIINGKDKAVIPSFMNSHTHAAMNLLRGYADDMELHDWLQNKIWPLEAKLTNEELYWGTKLACLEMIKSGITFFNDMYFFKPEQPGKNAITAAIESGIRMCAGHVLLDFNPENRKKEFELQKQLISYVKELNNPLISVAVNPHSIYACSKQALLECKKIADENNLNIHIHLSETEKEVKDCLKQNKLRPVEYLEKIGFFKGKIGNIIAAHVIHVNDNEIKILKKYQVKIAHTPVSNMKLCSGMLPYAKLKKSGLTINLGTDGCASNNNLDMLEEMKFATLLQKINYKNPTLMPAKEAFELLTINPAKTFELNCGEIKEGNLADLLLIDLKNINLNPRHNLISNLVYSANRSCIDTTICNGKILMLNKKVPGEKEIIEKANEVAMKLVGR